MSSELATGLPTYQLYIDGEFVEPQAGVYHGSVNPTSGEEWYRFAEASELDVDRAVKAARAAQGRWRAMRPVDRAKLMRRIADGLAQRADELAEIEVADNGKLIREVRLHLRGVPTTWEYHAGWADKIHGDLIPSDGGTINYLRREPLGVVAVIAPWNSPLGIACSKIAPALATGNTVVVKPSEHTSASMLKFVEVLEEAGLPKGVVNVITGMGASTGDALVSHPDVDLISFTGGTATGRSIAARAAKRPIKTVLELGGKSPNIVFADADLDKAAAGVIAGIFAAAGQTCVAGSRCFVAEEVYDELLSRVHERTAKVRLGDPRNEQTDVGPIAFRAHMERILGYIDSGISDGAVVRLGGSRVTTGELAKGFFVEPTILENVDNSAKIAREEIFGPVLSVMRFSEEEQVLAMANDSPYGLAAGVWTQSLSRAHRMAAQLEAGTVWVNTYRAMSPLSPFGGFKQSGYGKDNGRESIQEYMRAKSVWIDIADEPPSDPFVARRMRFPE